MGQLFSSLWTTLFASKELKIVMVGEFFVSLASVLLSARKPQRHRAFNSIKYVTVQTLMRHMAHEDISAAPVLPNWTRDLFFVRLQVWTMQARRPFCTSCTSARRS